MPKDTRHHAPRKPGHDHIVRDAPSHDRIRHYIHTWHRDRLNRTPS
jgi:hypothetical protein